MHSTNVAGATVRFRFARSVVGIVSPYAPKLIDKTNSTFKKRSSLNLSRRHAQAFATVLFFRSFVRAVCRGDLTRPAPSFIDFCQLPAHRHLRCCRNAARPSSFQTATTTFPKHSPRRRFIPGCGLPAPGRAVPRIRASCQSRQLQSRARAAFGRRRSSQSFEWRTRRAGQRPSQSISTDPQPRSRKKFPCLIFDTIARKATTQG